MSSVISSCRVTSGVGRAGRPVGRGEVFGGPDRFDGHRKAPRGGIRFGLREVAAAGALAEAEDPAPRRLLLVHKGKHQDDRRHGAAAGVRGIERGRAVVRQRARCPGRRPGASSSWRWSSGSRTWGWARTGSRAARPRRRRGRLRASPRPRRLRLARRGRRDGGLVAAARPLRRGSGEIEHDHQRGGRAQERLRDPRRDLGHARRRGQAGRALSRHGQEDRDARHVSKQGERVKGQAGDRRGIGPRAARRRDGVLRIARGRLRNRGHERRRAARPAVGDRHRHGVAADVRELVRQRAESARRDLEEARRRGVVAPVDRREPEQVGPGVGEPPQARSSPASPASRPGRPAASPRAARPPRLRGTSPSPCRARRRP